MRQLKIIICPTSGIVLPYIIDDIKISLERLGHIAVYFPLIEPNHTFDNDIAMKFIKDFMPDYVFMLGISGLIYQKGKPLHFLDEQKIPYIMFFFDFPIALLDKSKYSFNSLKAVFIWDKILKQKLEEQGYRNVYYLPLATNPHRFFPFDKVENLFKISFVGSIAEEDTLNTQIDKLIIQDRDLYDKLIISYMRQGGANIYELLENEYIHQRHVNSMDIHDESFLKLFYLLDAKLNTMIRKQVIYGVASKYLTHVFGTSSWTKLANKNILVNPAISYNIVLNHLYNQSKINLNITSPHLLMAINQRIFDVGASKGFVLSDYRDSVVELFDEDEIVCYKDRNDLLEKVTHFLNNDGLRSVFAKKLHEKVIAKHTWEHRVQHVLDILRQMEK
ncbi:MAG: hypothetical protein DKM50_04045 [Candidatus Margulisiibacteriota bacterium]|nr:MAG: hypothetical protein A2X43_01760 [Candidatus Margulisbacteria bacterium GWD2_39_127]OGI05490.1 MAG: hypothetical protein A2X42_00075 [Candidatus Margulisbacteria bacterium GWF2_38_17]OGI08312.1 MAG: hypothetical protein A2X41_00170 [Candidatus Margulisbacteria bacterium GWE2_39_32]PZM82308.1 MAG: hypothetical protein DKM50_04045 [Candidatus Margulisiibacteriota bacterium]HAR62946.1 hypothetical protein [Candidatus Margulisiibacteriota bacterium]